MVLWTIALGQLLPSEAAAQDAPAAYAESEWAPKHADAEAVEEAAEEPEEARWELSIGVAPIANGASLGGLSGLAGLAGNLTPQMVLGIGVPLGSRALLSVGATGSYLESSGNQYGNVSIPLGVLLYLDRPRSGAFIPTVRVTASGWLWSSTVGFGAFGLGVGIRGGLTWLPSDRFGLRAEVGGHLGSQFSETFTSVSLALDAELSLVVRV